MIKIKQLLSACLATAMLFSMSVTASAADSVAYGDYTIEVAYKNATSDTGTMMSGYMASTTVPVTVDANGYTFTLDIYNYYKPDNSDAVDSVKYGTDNASWTDLTLEDVSAEYGADDFYDRVYITVDSLDAFYMQAYVFAMASAAAQGANPVQSWRVVPDASTLTKAGVSSQSMTISATVAKNVSTSTVTIPESTNMGELSKTQDTVVAYSVDIEQAAGQTVTVTADETVTLTNGTASLTIANKFDGKNGTLTASAADVAAVATDSDLELSGALSFTITIA